MYAIFEDGSRQYRVSVGDKVRLDHREIAAGATLTLDRVLMHADGAAVTIGQPTVGGAKVLGEVIDHPSEKYVIQHFRRRKHSKRLKGHRQHYVEVKITQIVTG